ncbi:Uncharacterized protein HZ326_24751 [Fusarium oxysporum f. sp. albedinis]|nr:Uncharacterized protein HZ326_24751 [Fusarium oxysporum f. sp. albedinis]
MGEQTGSRIFHYLWSYVTAMLWCQPICGSGIKYQRRASPTAARSVLWHSTDATKTKLVSRMLQAAVTPWLLRFLHCSWRILPVLGGTKDREQRRASSPLTPSALIAPESLGNYFQSSLKWPTVEAATLLNYHIASFREGEDYNTLNSLHLIILFAQGASSRYSRLTISQLLISHTERLRWELLSCTRGCPKKEVSLHREYGYYLAPIIRG